MRVRYAYDEVLYIGSWTYKCHAVEMQEQTQRRKGGPLITVLERVIQN